MKIRYSYWKDGKKKALTMSYDDGQIADLRLLDIFNKNGIRGTFPLNADNIGRDNRVTAEDVRTKYLGSGFVLKRSASVERARREHEERINQ